MRRPSGLEVAPDPRVILAIDNVHSAPNFRIFDRLVAYCWGIQLNNSIHGNDHYHAYLERAKNNNVRVLLNALESHTPKIFAQNLEGLKRFKNIAAIAVSGTVDIATMKGYKQAVIDAGMEKVAIIAQGYSTNYGEAHAAGLFKSTPSEITRTIAKNASDAGLDGIKASAKDLEGFYLDENNGLRPRSEFIFIANGIRRASDLIGEKDPGRVTDVQFAESQGASKFIIGGVVMDARLPEVELVDFLSTMPPLGQRIQ